MWTARKGVRWLSRELRPQRDEVSVELVVNHDCDSFHSNREITVLERNRKNQIPPLQRMQGWARPAKGRHSWQVGPHSVSGSGPQVGQDGQFRANGRSFELEAILMDAVFTVFLQLKLWTFGRLSFFLALRYADT